MTVQKNVDVAAKVRGIAAEKRVRQADLASALNVSRMAIVRRFNGSVPFTDRELIALASHLGVPVGAFFGEVPA
ncbi:helix-turn-helix domain-containing protein [Leifsonia aquatica]|uniref:helix-turn-helix domain-containing protein n=1 Tax=Leifsonia aquatica TaxID=144185 RepID=UPI000E205BBC|nr:helix-turn-helix transcriptional regulator [Leifsonia aquatica]